MAEAWVLPIPYDWGFWLENLSVSGGVALNGEEQNVFGENMRWRARGKVNFRTADQVRDGRGLFARLQGRAGTLLVPTFDGKRVSWPIEDFNGNVTGVVLHPGVTREPLLEGTVYQSLEIPARSEVICTLTDAVALRATSANMTFAQGGPPLAGQYFGLANALYIVKSVTGPASGDVYTVTFLPPARATAADNATVKWTRPVCEMRQASDDQGIKELQSLRFADVSVEFVENF